MSAQSSADPVRLIAQRELAAIDRAAQTEGASVVRVDLAGCRTKSALLTRIADAFSFPPTFGGNWDALADCLGDLDWQRRGNGHVWLFDHADELGDAAPTDFATFVEILVAACTHWHRQHVACRAYLGFDHVRDTQAARQPRH